MLAFVCKLGRSFRCAFRGLSELFKTQNNARIHALAALSVLLAGNYFRVSPVEWAVLSLAIAVVLATESMNTAVEILSDRITLQQDPVICRVKDMAAGAVVVSAIGAAVAGLFIFIPHFFQKFTP